MKFRTGVFAFLWITAFVPVGCGGAGSVDSAGGGAADLTTTGGDIRAPEGSGPGASGTSCATGDPNQICLALKYVVYADSAGNEVVSRDIALKNVVAINKIWSPCRIAFQIDEYIAVLPKDFGLLFNPANSIEMIGIRRSQVDDATLLVVTTGTWNRDGSLGATGANAWTSMPEEGPYGVVLERPVGDFSNIIAHELGHYLNLGHMDDANDLMNPVIYNASTQLTALQCEKARLAAGTYWQRMLR